MSNILLSAVLFCTVGLFVPAPAFAAGACGAGTGCGGGGSLLILGDGTPPVLVDRLSLDPDFIDHLVAQRPNPLPPERTDAKLESFLPESNNAYQLAIKKLEVWRATSPSLVDTLEDTLPGMGWSRTRSEFNVFPDRYRLPQSVLKKYPKARVVTAVLYLDRYGSVMSTPVMNQADVETQAGLMIHEALREFQGAYHQTLDQSTYDETQKAFRKDHNFSMTDDQIQRLTATILDRKPEAGESLETEKYLPPDLAGFFRDNTRVPIRLREFEKKTCALMTDWDNETAQFRIRQQAGIVECMMPSDDNFARFARWNLMMQTSSLGAINRDFIEFELKRFGAEYCAGITGTDVFQDLMDFSTEIKRCYVSAQTSTQQKDICQQMDPPKDLLLAILNHDHTRMQEAFTVAHQRQSLSELNDAEKWQALVDAGILKK